MATSINCCLRGRSRRWPHPRPVVGRRARGWFFAVSRSSRARPRPLRSRVNGTVATQNVWGLDYVNDLVATDTSATAGDLGISGSGLGQRLYAQHDANFDVTVPGPVWNPVGPRRPGNAPAASFSLLNGSLGLSRFVATPRIRSISDPPQSRRVSRQSLITDTTGAVVERYEYDPYGNVTVLNPDGTIRGDGTLASSHFGVPNLFQGMRYDSVTGLYASQTRDLNPATGTWLQADPGGYVDGASRYQGFDSSPASRLDPVGLDAVAAANNSPSTRPAGGDIIVPAPAGGQPPSSARPDDSVSVPYMMALLDSSQDASDADKVQFLAGLVDELSRRAAYNYNVADGYYADPDGNGANFHRAEGARYRGLAQKYGAQLEALIDKLRDGPCPQQAAAPPPWIPLIRKLPRVPGSYKLTDAEKDALEKNVDAVIKNSFPNLVKNGKSDAILDFLKSDYRWKFLSQAPAARQKLVDWLTQNGLQLPEGL